MKLRIQSLDGLRGIAILLVVAGHVVAHVQPLGSESRRWLEAFANPGAGVRLFFVLSGYLITSLLLLEQERTGRINITAFYRRRALRILPAFYAYLSTLTVASLWFPLGINSDTFIAAATFTWNYAGFWVVPPPEGTWNVGHLWTLALEQQFYLLWPVAMLLCGKRRALWLAVALVCWCPVARVASYFLFPGQRGFLGMMLHTGIDSLMMGCAAALLLTAAGWRDRLLRHGPAAALVGACWLFLVSPVMGELVRGFRVAAGYTLDAAAAATVVSWAHFHGTTTRLVALRKGVLPWLGVISYSLYVWQQPFLSPEGALQYGNILVPVTAALCGAVASHYLVERPFLRVGTSGPSTERPAQPSHAS